MARALEDRGGLSREVQDDLRARYGPTAMGRRDYDDVMRASLPDAGSCCIKGPMAVNEKSSMAPVCFRFGKRPPPPPNMHMQPQSS